MSSVIDLTDEGTLLVHPDMEAMESTCNGLYPGNPHDAIPSELSTISSVVSAQSDPSVNSEQQQLKVYLRVRPFSKEELTCGEDQNCVVLESEETVALQAPRGSASLKCSEKGIGQALHKFSFSQIFGPDTSQSAFFQNTIKTLVTDFLRGKHALIFTYGVTNAGKTYTIQGSQKDPGILPRTFDVIFDYTKGKQYDHMDLKPYLSRDVQYLSAEDVKLEQSAKAALFALLKDENENSKGSPNASSCYTSSLSFSSISYDHTADSTDTAAERDQYQYSVWVSYCEIYNELVYDLLQPLLSKKSKRIALRVCEDGSGNAYIRGLKWINVQNSEEVCKVMKVGNRNRSAAATKMNQSSSRSHSIFAVRLLTVDGTEVQRVTELSLCDLAGSERCTKTQTFGERLKEAGNINNSLLILGKCIAALRHQSDRIKNYIPFRESKLTRLFQSIFCGRGRACMVVNINQCASTYDETLHVMKFSAVAKQVVQIMPAYFENPGPKLVGRDGKAFLQNGFIDKETVDGYLSEDELFDEDGDCDVSILPQEELVVIIENLKEQLLAERRKNLVQEIEIRNEMGNAMLQQLMESETLRSRQIAELKESYQEKLESTFDLYKDALKEHAYQCALGRVEDEYVPLEEFFAEQERVEGLKMKLSEMEQRLRQPSQISKSTLEKSSQCTLEPSLKDCTEDVQKYEAMCKAKCSAERLCAEQKEVISSLEKKMEELTETLQEAGESFMEKSAEVEILRKALSDKVGEMEKLKEELDHKVHVVSSLMEKLAKHQKESPEKPKSRKGLLANIKETVTSPRKGALSRTLKKSVRSNPVVLKK